jgi:hypothetical protein
MHLAYPNTASTTLYSTPIIFDRNAYLVPDVVRVADIVWCAAGLSGQYRGSTICPPTSVYSVPLELIDRVGGWDTGPEAIGEDLHMYLKCFFALNGNLTSRTVTSPASQTNITASSGKGLVGQFLGIKARYRQALRHMWGSLDTGYALQQVVKVWRRRRQKQQPYRPLHETRTRIETSFDWQMNISDTHVNVRPPNWINIILLFHRLFEAHFMPAHISILILTSTLISLLAPNNQLFSNTYKLTISILQTTGLVTLLIYFYSYETYHHLALQNRRNEMITVGLEEGMRGSFSERKLWNLVDCVCIPVVAPLFGSAPAIQAQLCHFWSAELDYVVSSKSVRKRD